MAEHVDVLIITALALERQAVRAHLSNVEIERESNLAADIGVFRRGAGDLAIAVIETGAGNVAASEKAVRAEDAFRPAIALMVGIAAGLKDVDGGDVVASSKVYWHEGGKQRATLAPRPDFAAVSDGLVQAARAVVAEDCWQQRLSPEPESPPRAKVGAIVAGEKVQADSQSAVMKDVRSFYSDALCLDMEDFGALRGAGVTERAKTLAIRGISDLIDDKDDVNEAVSQPQAAANAAAFVFELLDTHFPVATQVADRRGLAETGAELYPQGPDQDGLWERAGGDAARLVSQGTGWSRWWHAAGLVERGGGVTLSGLLREMRRDYPDSVALARLGSTRVSSAAPRHAQHLVERGATVRGPQSSAAGPDPAPVGSLIAGDPPRLEPHHGRGASAFNLSMPSGPFTAHLQNTGGSSAWIDRATLRSAVGDFEGVISQQGRSSDELRESAARVAIDGHLIIDFIDPEIGTLSQLGGELTLSVVYRRVDGPPSLEYHLTLLRTATDVNRRPIWRPGPERRREIGT